MKIQIPKPIRSKILNALETQTRTEINVLYNGLVDSFSDQLLEFAVNNFELSGRGIIKIHGENNFDVTYLNASDFEREFAIHEAHYRQMKEILSKYEPDVQFVVMIVDTKGTSFLIHSKRHLKKS